MMKEPGRKAKTFKMVLALLVLALALTGCSLLSSGAQPTPTPPPSVVQATPALLPETGAGSAATPVSATAQPAPVAQANPAAPAAAPSAVAAPSGDGASSTGNFTAAIRDVVQRVRPAIVQITNEQVQVDQFNQATVPAGVGSGIIYDNEGHILTNNHVVAGASKLLVTLPDGRSFPGKLIGGDALTDLAVVQISGNNLPVAALGDSTKLQVGDWVVAIGNALALPGGPTVTAGLVSALNRTVQEPSDQQGGAGPVLFDVIQTSAPINPGNSGGALVNLSGQVVGINTLVAGQAEPGVQAQGIGFAIAINTAKPIADELVRTGRAVHPSLGVGYLPLNPGIAAQLNLPQSEGALIRQVTRGGPADQAGIQPGDVITAVDGHPVKQDSDLPLYIQSHKPGDRVTLTVLRNGQTLNIQVTLGQMSAS